MAKNNPLSPLNGPNLRTPARLFFAVWPEASCRHRLAATARNLTSVCGGRQMFTGNLHMTLLFIGAIDRSLIPALEAAASGLRVPSFEIALDRLDCFGHHRIACAAPGRVPEALSMLASQLREAVAATGIGFDRKPFVPHVTLLRNIDRSFAARTMPALAWHIGSFALVESIATERGVRYRTLETWQLR